jgi:2,3-bisphosphoglycerate-independent phosphoglycerate mutase
MLGYRPDEFPGRAVLEALGARQEADPSDVFAFAALRPADERGGELWLTGRPRRGEDDEEARTLLERCDGIEVDGLRFSLSDLGRGEAILRVSGGADDRVTDSDAFFRDWYPVLRPQPVVPEAELTARAADEWMREVLRRLEGARFNVITLKWWGRPREAPTFAERHGVSGTFIAASRFMHGLARAVGLEPLEEDRQGGRLLLEILLDLGEVSGRQVAAVRARLLGERAAPILRVEEAPAMLDQLLHHRPQLSDGPVGLFESEVA